MLVVLCGLIGSGKTTYAQRKFKKYTDLDEMGINKNKTDQIKLTEKLLLKGNRVCHITTYPTDEEIEKLKKYKPMYLCIRPNINQCKTNILIRQRKRDLDNIANVLKANIELKGKIYKSDIPFIFLS